MKKTYLFFLSFSLLFVSFKVKETIPQKPVRSNRTQPTSKLPKRSPQIAGPSSCPASPYPITVKQADGSSITIIGKGNMANSWTETLDGYTVIKKEGIYEYATERYGKLTPSGIQARDAKNRKTDEKQFLQSVPKSLRTSAVRTSAEGNQQHQVLEAPQKVSFPSTGTRKTLLILIKYPDLANTYTLSNFDNLMNQSNYNGTGSFKDFYKTSSFGKLDLSTDVFGWYTASNNYAYYGHNEAASRATKLVREAIDAAEAAGVDFSKYDNDKDGNVDGVIIAHSGPGAEEGSSGDYVWSHRWQLSAGNNSVTYDGVTINDYIINPERRLFSSAMVGIGVFCHEFGHNLGLPDLYDTSGNSEGIGNWCLMAGGAWLGYEHSPANMSAWCKMTLGWMSPTVITASGAYSLKGASANAECYRINTQLSNEYFLIENRQKTGLDVSLNGSGLAIWHINTNKTSSTTNNVNADRTLKGVDLEEADGLNQLDSRSNRGDAGDLFPGTSNNKNFNDFSFPNSRTYTAANTGIGIKNISIDGSGNGSFNYEDLKTIPPTLTSFTPTSASPGNTVNITGTNFTFVNSVSFGGVAPKSFIVTSPTNINAVMSTGATGNVTVSSPAGSSTLSGFTYVPPPPPPAITSISPAFAAIDSVVTIRGREFSTSAGQNVVYFGGVKANVLSASSTSITVTVPKGAGYVPISVTANGLTGYSSKPFSTVFPNIESGFSATSFEKTSLPLSNSNYQTKAAVSADFNNDGLLDLALAQGYNYSISIYKNNGDSKQPFTSSQTFSANSLQNLAAADFNGDGKLDLISCSSSYISIFKNISSASTIAFSRSEISATIGGDIAVADFDGDGSPDLAYLYNNQLYVRRNTTANDIISFGSPITLSAGSYPSALFASDLNADEKPEIYVANNGSNTVSVFKNTSETNSISFNTKLDFATGSAPTDVVSGDFDGDELPDLAISNSGGNSISILKNSSTGSDISFAGKVDFVTGTNPYSVEIADFDGDSKPDLATGNNSSVNLSILRNASTGNTISFATKTDYISGGNAMSLIAADWNNDGKPDIALHNYGNNTYTLLRNQLSEPSLSAYQIIANDATHNVILTGTNLNSAKSVKIGNTPVKSFTVVSETSIKALVNENTSGTISVATTYGTANLQNFSNVPVPVITSLSPRSGAIGSSVTIKGSSFDSVATNNIVYFGAVKAEVSSGNKDSLVVKVPKGSTYLPVTLTTKGLTASTNVPFNVSFAGLGASFTNTTFSVKKDYPLNNSSYPRGIATADFNGDGNPDLVITNSNNNTLSIFKNSNNDFGTSANASLSTNSSPKNISVGDIDGDGLLDIVIGYTSSYSVSIFRNTSSNGSISFAAKVDLATPSYANEVSISDLNNDGKADLAALNYYSNSVSVFRSQSFPGTIAFATKSDYSTGSSPVSISATDLDGDNKSELVVVNNGSNTISVLKNTSTPSQILFSEKTDLATGSYPTGLCIADIDGDNKPDLAFTNNSSNFISVLRNSSNTANISFAARADFIAINNCENIKASDIDGDGKPDLVVSSSNSNFMSLYKNISTNGIISLAPKADYTTGSAPFGICIADWTGDGKPDIAVANSSSSSFSLFTNKVNEPMLASYAISNGGTYNVTLTGANLTNASSVTFGGKAATSYTVVAENTITALVPAETSGEIKVVTPYGTGSLNGFTNIPAPSISSISPQAGDIGSTVTITGANFSTTAAGNTVYFGTVKAAVTAASSTSITVKVPAGASYAPIKVTANYLTASSAKNFNVTFAGGNAVFSTTSFAPKSDISSNYAPYDLASADFDGDGKVDLAVVTYSYLNIYKNAGNSNAPISSSPSLSLTVGSSSRALTVADVDGDGLQDIAVVNSSSNTVSIFRNTSTGSAISFASKIDIATGSYPNDVIAGDFDLDGKQDLAVTNGSSCTVSIFRNTGSSGNIAFASKVDLQASSYSSPFGIISTDLDLDGKADLTITNNGSSSISVFRNTSSIGQMSFATKADFSTGSSPAGITVGDFDLDGKNDLAIANNSSASVSVLRNTSTGGSVSFSTKLDLSTGSSPFAIAVEDINGDGKPDIALSGYSYTNLVSVLANSGNNSISFNTKADYLTGNSPYALAVSDLTGDGKPDILSANNSSSSISILKNQVTEPTLTSYRINTGSTTANVTLTGTNLGSATAVTFAGKAATSYTVVSATSITALVPENTTGTVTVTTPYGTASINGFSNIPAPIISSFSPESGNAGTSVTISGANFALTTEENTVYFGAVKATVTAATSTSLTVTVPAGASYKPITVTANNLTAYSAKPFGVTFSYDNPLFPNNAFAKPAAITSSSYSPTGTIVTDLDGDGKADLIVSNDYYLYVYKNNGSATAPYSSSASLSLSLNNGYVQNVSFGDIDGDGKQDILLSTSANVVSIFRNTSSGSSLSFASKVEIPTGNNPQGIAIADVDLDGRTDVLTANYGSNTVSVIFNQSYSGNILFAPKTDYLVGSSPIKVAAADFDADGYPDIAVTNYYSNSVSVLLNTKANGVFKTKTDFATGSNPVGLATADINADGKPDLVACNNYSNTISVLKNTSGPGSASFATKTDFSTGSYPRNVIISDLNGDGLPDIAVSNSNSSSISVFKNTSTSSSISLSTKADYNISSPLDIVINDLNGDSRPDIAVPSSYSSTYFLRNTVTSAPLITSFTPTNACTGSPITITGVNFTGVTSVNIGGYAAASYTVNSSTSITATPNSYVSGANSITITNADGSNTISGLTVQSTPVIYYSGYKTIKKGSYSELYCSSYYSSFQWYKDGVAISGATSYYYRATERGSYTVSTGACQSLPVAITVVSPSDIKVSAVSATCKGSDNGKLVIKATYPASYQAVVTKGSITYATAIFNSEYEKSNLAPGTYSVTVSVAESNIGSQTYTVQVTEPKDLSVYSSINENNEKIDLILEGASNYIIKFNGQTITTSQNAISLKLAKGENKLSVSTDIACQGVYEKTFVVSNEVLVYPNPFDQILHIGLGANAQSEAEVKIYTLDGKLAHSKTYKNVDGLISPELSGLNPGTYILRLTSGNSSTIHRIVKK